MTPGRLSALLLAFAIFLAWFAWLRPTALGGPASFVIISGESMEPTYHEGDLVILRKGSSYSPGDVVAYPMQTYFKSGRLVIHRITGAGPEGFITQGDNRDQPDPWRATGANIRGSAWLHIPNAGTFIAWLREPWRMAALAVVVLLAGGARTAEINRRRRHRMKRHFGPVESWLPGRAELGAHQPVLGAFAAGAAILALAFLALGFLAFRSATHQQKQVQAPAYSETGRFEYAIVMEPSTLYPDGILRPAPQTAAPAPAEDSEVARLSAFTALSREARLQFEYELKPAGGEADLEGTLAADLVIRPEGGEWSRTIPLQAPIPFAGTTASAELTVDLVGVGALIARIEEETGLTGRSYQLQVLANVVGSGARAGEAFTTEFQGAFTLEYDSVLVRPPADLTTTRESTTTDLVTSPRTVSLVAGSMPVARARTVAAVGFMASLGALAVAGGYLLYALWTDEQARIRARYGSRLVDVEVPPVIGDEAIRVASIRDLARLAERAGTVILHTPLPDCHRYFVRDGDDTYEYLVPAAGVPGSTTATRAARKA